MKHGFLPLCRQDMLERKIEQFDFVYIIGDAYVDHPSFGPAIISRLLESHGYTVGIISQPDWKQDESIAIYGEPRLAFLVCSGNMDSMVNHYYVSKKPRQTDAYTPGGETGKRPDYAAVVYGNLIRKTYKHTPVILGGIEASLRRLAHYDYWSNHMKRSVLLDSGADMISYGMGEHSVIEIADALHAGIAVGDLTFIKGTVYKTTTTDNLFEAVILPDYERVSSDKKAYSDSFMLQYENTDAVTGKILVEQYGKKQYVVQNPPALPLTTEEMDDVYGLPYMRTYHPSYTEKGGIPAIAEVKFSLISSRGCFGGCNFCALTFHQGRTIQQRSHDSIVEEAEQFQYDPEFKGYIHDVGGPTANFRQPSCAKQQKAGVCKKQQCLFPEACRNLRVDHSDYVELLRKLRKVPKVKKVFIRSGIRYDYLIYDQDMTFFRELVEHHISGQLKVAPEHVSERVLHYMGKPGRKVYDRFCKKYQELNEKAGKNQFLVPYLMSSHPGSTLKDAIELAEYLRELGYMPEQVQDFYPTPSTMSTVMYYTELDPRTGKSVYVPKNPHEKALQRALIQYRNPQNYDAVMEALHKEHREDLIGFDEHCLIRPRRLQQRRVDSRQRTDSGKKRTIRTIHKKKS